MPVPEPVLQDYKNIECRDAVLAYDGEPELVRDEKGKPVTRWDGETMKVNPVTGEQVPDESARVNVYKYKNPRKAEWPEADFIVGNPPFVGNKRMRLVLGDGYVEALRAAHDDMPETADSRHVLVEHGGEEGTCWTGPPFWPYHNKQHYPETAAPNRRSPPWRDKSHSSRIRSPRSSVDGFGDGCGREDCHERRGDGRRSRNASHGLLGTRLRRG
jgi:hypothetical protein